MAERENDTNPAFDKEQAEGERDTVEQALDDQQEDRQGITNRPAAEEQQEQAELPPRGEAKND